MGYQIWKTKKNGRGVKLKKNNFINDSKLKKIKKKTTTKCQGKKTKGLARNSRRRKRKGWKNSFRCQIRGAFDACVPHHVWNTETFQALPQKQRLVTE
jgi:glutamate synthase domain-containing protein 2